MGGVVLAAQLMRKGVYVTYVSAGKGDTTVVGGVLHVTTGFDVGAFEIGFFQVLEDELGATDGLFASVVGVGVSDIGFYRVGERVHTGGGSNVLGQAYGKSRIEHGELRDQHGVVDGALGVVGVVADNGGDRRFATRSRSGRHGEERGQLLHDFEVALQLLNSLVGASYAATDRLGAVHGRTAAYGNDTLATVGLIKFVSFVDEGNVRVG